MDTAAFRFAEFTVRCCRCGRVLRHRYSKTVGIGPVCRNGMTEAELEG
ncbi:DUF6011 domain-containing protein [Actinopolyspora halophila]